ncbi:MAG TPA: SDR family oxidoreductase [Terriglobales bacterium]|nr:SDR family oxidoreductase [Terriglobales bacterium]
MSLRGEIAVVTGGRGLIGSAICRRLAGEGAVVIAASRSAATDRSRPARESSGKIIPVVMDVTDERRVKTAFAEIVKRYGPPRILVANASCREALESSFDRIAAQHFADLCAVDIAGHFLCAQQFAAALPKGESGSIVFLSSIYAIAGADPELSSAPPQYGAAKGALLGLTRSLAARWGRRGIRVNAVIAGGVEAPGRQSAKFRAAYGRKTMLRRMARAEEIASAVAFLASGDASYITGAALAVDGGYTAW